MRFLLFAIFTSTYLFSQQTDDFKKNKVFYLNGDTQIVANSILGKHKSNPFNKLNHVNDEYKMVYIDVDKDKSTFSSSTAKLNLPDNSKLIYAGLYWTATYPGDKGVKTISKGIEGYKNKELRSTNFRNIKIKTPGNTDYQDITGEVLYDGINDKLWTLKRRAPYVCYKDITTLLGNTTNGDFTIANVAALQGHMPGGSSAGWFIYVVYENNNKPLQYVSTYDGFELIKRHPKQIIFSQFKAQEKGKVDLAMTIGALEGDFNIGKDQVTVLDKKEKEFRTIKTKTRDGDNFFNSSITLNNNIYKERTPNSDNTLGFDIAKIDINNDNNAIIDSKSDNVTFEFRSKEDQYFLFFVAFQSTISDAFFENLSKNPQIVTNKPSITKQNNKTKQKLENNTSEASKKLTQSDRVKAALNIKKPKTTTPIVTKQPTPIKTPVNQKPNQIQPIANGTYIVSNVFSNINNAKKWKQKLISENINAEIFYRESNKFYYVTIYRNPNLRFPYTTLNTVKKKRSTSNAWVLQID